MGIYSARIFPHLMDRALSTEEIQRIRRSVLANVQGEVFEIGFGTGLNLQFYPSAVKRITTADPNSGAARLAEPRIASASIEVVRHPLSAESLPVESSTFDSIVCTFTLCSIRDVDKALSEMWRILKSAGRFHFIEHGLSDEPRVQRWQRLLTPLHRIVGDGCRLDRDPGALLRRNGFRIDRMDNFYLKKTPRFGGYIYRGSATKIQP